MLAAGHSVLPLSFRSLFFRRLTSEVASPIVTKLCHMVNNGGPYLKNSVRNLYGPLTPKFDGPKTSTFLRDFAQLRDLSRISPERNKTWSIGKRHCKHSRTGILNSVYFVLQTANNRTGVLTHPTGGYQAGHCHASSIPSSFSSRI